MSQSQSRTKMREFMKRKSVRAVFKAAGAFFKCILTMILIGMITASIVGCVLVVYVVTSFNSSDLPNLEEISLNESSIIYTKDSGGNFVETQHVQGINSIWADLDKIPLDMQNAVIAIEDERFYEHHGVDWKRTLAAAANLVLPRSGSQFGGSTITQQVIKNLTGDDETKISRKIREIFRALEMESSQATKEQILEAYLNILPLSGNIKGVGAAANYYFGKDVSELDLAECALIAGITQNPSKYNPYAHPDNVKQRQRVVLMQMYKLGKINEDEYKQAYNQELTFTNSLRHGVNDYYTDRLTEDVIRELMETYNYSEVYATQLFYYGGLHIYSAEDPALQAKAEAIYADDSNFPAHLKKDEEDPQSGICVLDYTGRLVVTVGGRGEKTADRVYNRSTDATRQPGSSIKPISVYTLAIKHNLVTYSTIMNDHPLTLSNGDKWPNNYEKNRNYGDLPVEDALQYSLNTIPAQLLQQLTPQRSFDFLTRSLHMSTLVSSRNISGKVYTDVDLAPLALGGLTDGVKCIDMAAAYQVFGNGGVYHEPYTFYRVERNGETILTNTVQAAQVLDTDTAYVMNRLLQRGVVGPYATGKGQKVGDNETFGKTGTTNENKDVFFVGGTPYYVGACWFGYDNNQRLVEGPQTAGAKTLWRYVMKELHNGLAAKNFNEFAGTTVTADYCRDTGLLATDQCPNKAVGVYKADNVPGPCTLHGGAVAQPTTEATQAATTIAAPETTKSTTKATTAVTAATTTTTDPNTNE